MAAYVHFEYAVYMLPVHKKDPQAVLRQAIAKQLPEVKLVTELPAEPGEMMVKPRAENNVQRDYAPPSVESLQYSANGLSDQEEKTLQGTQEAFILEFAHPRESVWAGLHAADELIEKVARETGGFVWDEETREVYSPDEWHKKRIGEWKEGVPDIATQMVIHLYENGEFLRAISLGMSKAGLPDVVVQKVSAGSAGNIGIVIDLFGQAMAEGKAFNSKGDFKLDLRAIQNARLRDPQLKSLKANATGAACLTLKEAEAEEGDAKNRIIELAFDRYEGNDAQAKQQTAINLLFGWEDSVTYVEHNDELLAESRKEKSKLPQLHKDFDAGLLPGEYIEVKAPFKTPDGGREWMWVEVRKWKGGAISGVLENQPEKVPELHDGQVVEVREGDIFDYIRHHPDGRDEGNTTGALLEKMGKSEPGNSAGTTLSMPKCAE
jgi:uncharacterized protein YegJ (DUF2314 family)